MKKLIEWILGKLFPFRSDIIVYDDPVNDICLGSCEVSLAEYGKCADKLNDPGFSFFNKALDIIEGEDMSQE